jgi:hypothetical protein
MVAAFAVAVPVGVASAGRKVPPPPPLPLEHTHPSGAFTFRTPEGWTLAPPTGRSDIMEVWGGDLGVRFLFRNGEEGYDTFHEVCKFERLAGPMDMSPQVRYEYEYIGGPIGDRRALDSAFEVTYDKAVHGHRVWRHRTLSVVGAGQSLCAVSYAPLAAAKSPKKRAMLDAVLASVTFRR